MATQLDSEIAGQLQPMPRGIAFEHHNYRLRQCRHGAMLYLTNDRYIGRSFDLYGEYSEAELALLLQIARPGGTIVEVGANIGAHTVPMAQSVGPTGTLHAFEPQRVIFQLLNANLALNGIGNVHTHREAAGGKPGRAFVPPLDYAAVDNFGGISMLTTETQESAPITTLDSLALARCDLLKVDVEGMEAEVISGAVTLIDRFRPLMYVENDRREKSVQLVELIVGLGYRCYWHAPPLFNPNNFAGHHQNVLGKIRSINMLCVPRERPIQVQGLAEVLTIADNGPPGSLNS